MRGPVKLRHGRTDGRASGAITYAIWSQPGETRARRQASSHCAHPVQAEEEGGGGRGGEGIYKCPGLFRRFPSDCLALRLFPLSRLLPWSYLQPTSTPPRHLPRRRSTELFDPSTSFPPFSQQTKKAQTTVCPKLRRAYPRRPFTPSKQRAGSIDARLPLPPPPSFKMPATNGTPGDSTPPMMEKINTNIVTLTRFLTEEQIKHKEATGDFTYGALPLLPTGSDTMPTASCATRSSFRSSPSPTTSGARRSST